MKRDRPAAPIIDLLLEEFDYFRDASVPSQQLYAAMDSLFAVLRELAPSGRNKEVKSIWITIPRGNIDDYSSYEDMLQWGDVKNRDEYESLWRREYPNPVSWYELVIREAFHPDGSPWFRAVWLRDVNIINAVLDREPEEKMDYPDQEEDAITLCSLIKGAAEEAMMKLREGTYNEAVKKNLPYPFRTGLIKRTVVYERKPDWAEEARKGISKTAIQILKQLLDSGANDISKIRRLKKMTANDFFRACAIGYKACGYDGTDLSPVDQYFIHADGRDEGLTGRGYGQNEGPGIDPDDPDAWDEWYFHRRQWGGHPWEVCRGGSYSHLALFVEHDRQDIEYLYEDGEISDDEYRERLEASGYYFTVGGMYRMAEAVSFYTALSAAGLPVVLSGADAIMSRLEGTGYIGIVPHSETISVHCADMFPEEYGDIFDFIHVSAEEMELFRDSIEWLLEEEARLIEPTKERTEH